MSEVYQIVDRGYYHAINPPEQCRLTPYEIGDRLSKIKRWNGTSHVNVAQHSVIVANIAERIYYNSEDPLKLVVDLEPLRLLALLHDATEVIIGDIPSPVKKKCPDLVALEADFFNAICKVFDIDPKKYPDEATIVTLADEIASQFDVLFLDPKIYEGYNVTINKDEPIADATRYISELSKAHSEYCAWVRLDKG